MNWQALTAYLGSVVVAASAILWLVGVLPGIALADVTALYVAAVLVSWLR